MMMICIKMDLALNNLRRLICHKTKLNQNPIQGIGCIGLHFNSKESFLM